MKKTLLILFCLYTAIAFPQKLQFPESFKYDPKIIPEMHIAVITDEAREAGIFKNPAVLLTQEEMIAVVNDFDLENVNRVYIEFYEEIKKDNRDDAGIVVTEFNSKESLEEILPVLRSQSNYVWLYVDKYLILVWNDGRESQERLKKSVDYYKKKLGTEEFKPKESHGVDMSETTEETTMAIEEDYPEVATMVDPGNTFADMGFSIVHTYLFNDEEIQNLQRYISKFEQNYNIQVAITSVGIYDKTDDMMKVYASDLVSNDKNRIKNNIVVLFDKSRDKSWIFFGTETGKILNKLPLDKLKSEFNQKLEKGEEYDGLNKILMEFEIALINASGQEAKIPGDYND